MNPSQHPHLFRRSRGFLIGSLLLFALTLARSSGAVLAASHAPSLSTPAEPQYRVVERWRGTLYNENWTYNSYVGCPWLCTGNGHRTDKYEVDLEVHDDGYVRGYVKWLALDDTYQQIGTNNGCGPVAETDYQLLECQYAAQLTQPRGEVFVEGKREVDRFTHKPVLKLEHYIVLDAAKSSWHAVGIHSETGAVIHKQEDFESRGFPFVPGTYVILTHEDGRSPTIAIDDSFSYETGAFWRYGVLIGTPVQPFLTLDRELLERSIFLDQVPIDETFTANTEWNSPDGGTVSWQLATNPPEIVGPTKAPAHPKIINVGGQGVGKKPLAVQAKTTLKQVTVPQTTQVQVAPPPGWAGPPSAISAVKDDVAVRYRSSVRFPDPAFKGELMVPSFVPWLGGKPLGIQETQGTLKWEALSTTEGQGSIQGKTGFKAMGGAVGGEIGGHGRVVLRESGVDIPEGGLDFRIFNKLSSGDEPLLKLVPALRPALASLETYWPPAARFLEERATAKLDLEPRLAFKFDFFTQDDKIKFKSAQVTPGFGIDVQAKLELIKKVLSAALRVGGSIAATFQYPAPHFKEAYLEGTVGVRVFCWRWSKEAQYAWKALIGGGAAASASAAEQPMVASSESGSWQPLDRSYLDRPNYARWHGDTLPARAQGVMGEDTLLAENVFPLANPALDIKTSASGSQMILVWAHDKPGSPVLSGGEIAYSRNYGSMWNTPGYLTNDDRDDLAPKAVHLPGSNDVLVLWQRMDTATPPDFNANPAAYASHWQIAARSLSDGAGVPVKQLSTGGSLNYRHQLGAIADGALAVWVNNPTSQVFGDAANPDRIIFARYKTAGKSWTAASPVLTGLAGMVSLDLATNGQYAALVYSRDTDGDLATDADSELYYVTWNGSSWSTATRLTNDTIADDDPQLALDAAGAPWLVWRQNGRLVFRHGSWNSTPDVLTLPDAAGRSDYELVRGSDGRLALVWQEVEPGVGAIGYAVYDAARGLWSGERTVPQPTNSGVVPPASSMATAMTAGLLPPDPGGYDGEVNGHLLVGYQLVHMERITVTVEGITIPNVPEMGQNDLRAASVPLAVNLSVSPADLSLPSGDVLQAVIRNTGDLAVQDVPVALHIGSPDPETGTSEAVTQTVPLIAAGSAVTLTYSIAGRPETIFGVEIDAGRSLSESDLSDNTALLAADLAIEPLPAYYSPGGALVRARVTQNGPRYVGLFVTSTLTLDAPDGPLVSWSQAAFPITPSVGITVSAHISTTGLGAGRHQLFWTLDPLNTLEEADRYNNVAGTTILVLPDLAANGELIYFGKAATATVPFTMTVRNLGNWLSSGGSFEVYDALPGSAGAHSLLKSALPAIQPGRDAEVSGRLNLAGLPAAGAGLSGIYVRLDPDGAVDEISENNNLVAAGEVLEINSGEATHPVYLPLVKR